MSKKKKIFKFYASGYSDDCASITGAVGQHEQELTEYDVGDVWFEFIVDSKVVGKCGIFFDRGEWEVRIESDIEISAGKALEPTGDSDVV